VGILRPDGETEAGTDVLAMTVRTYYMPNPDWRAICERGRALREAAGTLSGHAIGADPTPMLDRAAVAKAIGSASVQADDAELVELPEPLASVVDYLGEDLNEPEGREFVPTAELVEALGVEPTTFGTQMNDLGCRSKRDRIPTADGNVRQVRGYFTADIRASVKAAASAGAADDEC
jgi:S-DNA-T family DNA segregation ATPase FtsK/SpoIIIE